MARGGGTGSRNKKKKATEVRRKLFLLKNFKIDPPFCPQAGTTTQNGVDTSQKIPSDSGDKNKNIKHRKQKVGPWSPGDDQSLW